jgi:hypothetical protein
MTGDGDEEAGGTAKRVASAGKARPPARKRVSGRRGGQVATSSTIGKDSRARLARLFSWLDGRLDLLERRPEAAGEAAPSAAEQERQARTMSSLIRVYEKLLAIEARSAGDAPAGGKRRKGRDDDDGADGNETERRRRELAQRIDRLRKQVADGSSAGAAE